MKKYTLPDSDYPSDTVILANGAFPTHHIALAILKSAKYIVCCDGAINQLNDKNIVPSAIVGDCDSLSAENKKLFRDILHKNPDQETNDLTKAVQFCLKNGKNKVTILGATGKREDHTLGNISLLSAYIDIIDAEIITDYGIFNCINCDSEFESFPQEQVSIFSIEPSEITTAGLKYQVEKRIFSSWWQGTLNESLSNSFVIETNAKTIIYRVF